MLASRYEKNTWTGDIDGATGTMTVSIRVNLLMRHVPVLGSHPPTPIAHRPDVLSKVDPQLEQGVAIGVGVGVGVSVPAALGSGFGVGVGVSAGCGVPVGVGDGVCVLEGGVGAGLFVMMESGVPLTASVQGSTIALKAPLAEKVRVYFPAAGQAGSLASAVPSMSPRAMLTCPPAVLKIENAGAPTLASVTEASDVTGAILLRVSAPSLVGRPE